jgi:hypothetical protein
VLFRDPIEQHDAILRFKEPFTSLSLKLNNHEFKITIIHYLTYFEEFQTACETFFKLQDSIKKREISPSEFATKKKFQDVNPLHEIYVLSSVFFNKIGKF